VLISYTGTLVFAQIVKPDPFQFNKSGTGTVKTGAKSQQGCFAAA
jgi:hypothetical protein